MAGPAHTGRHAWALQQSGGKRRRGSGDDSRRGRRGSTAQARQAGSLTQRLPADQPIGSGPLDEAVALQQAGRGAQLSSNNEDGAAAGRVRRRRKAGARLLTPTPNLAPPSPGPPTRPTCCLASAHYLQLLPRRARPLWACTVNQRRVQGLQPQRQRRQRGGQPGQRLRLCLLVSRLRLAACRRRRRRRRRARLGARLGAGADVP